MRHFIRKYWKHLAFWGLAFSGSLLFLWSRVSFYDAFVRAVVNGLLVIGVVYFNIIVLIPWLFNRKFYLVYILASVVFLVGITWGRYYVDISFLPAFPYQSLMDNTPESKLVAYYWAASNFQFYVSLVYSLNVHLNREKQHNAELERQRLDAELKFLKSQLRPHFLLNTLNNIYTLTYLNHPQAPPMLMKLSESLKYLLYEGENESVNLMEEVRFIENYVELNKLRLDKPERIRFTYTGPVHHHFVPPLIFLAFIENAFKHSDTDENDAGFVRIALSVEPSGNLKFLCQNTIRPTRTTLKEQSGIGLQNVRQRLDILFGDKYTLHIAENQGVFEATLSFNTNYDQ